MLHETEKYIVFGIRVNKNKYQIILGQFVSVIRNRFP